MIRRATMADYDAIKALCNDPAIRGRMSDTTTEIDPLNWLQEPRNIILFDGDSAALFLWRWIGIYEVHVLFRCRGREAVALGRAMLALMFDGGAAMILCVVNYRLPEAAWFARRMGFSSRGLIQTIEGGSEMFQLESSEWA